jgi:pyridinium-3,5-biscarboxylic acid mononucleotide sulfurtransferase
MDSVVSREKELRAIIGDMRRVIVAYSGGVDSATLLAVAYEELGRDVLAVTGRSPSVATGEIEAAAALAEQIGAQHEIIETHEFDNALYRANGSDRCFHCKDELFSRIATLARSRTYHCVVDGFNADDGRSALDHRPGHQAGLRRGVRSPLAEAHLGKDDIRDIAKRLGLTAWNKPATPCLSSRVPYGTAIDETDLRKIDLAERYLRAIGYNIVRVRHFGSTARIEVPAERVAELAAARERIERTLHSIGYVTVEIDPRGYRTGSLNALPT